MAEQRSPHDSPKSDEDREADADGEQIAAEILDDVIGQVVEDADSVSDANAAGSSSSAASGLGPLGADRKRTHKSTLASTDSTDVSTSVGSESVPPTRKRGLPSAWSVDSVFNRSSSSSTDSPDPDKPDPDKVEDVKLIPGLQMYVTVRIFDELTRQERHIVRTRRLLDQRPVWDDGETLTEASIMEYLRPDVETEFRGTAYTFQILGGSTLLHNMLASTVGLNPIPGTQLPPMGEPIRYPDYATIAHQVIGDWRTDYQVVHLLPQPPPPSGGAPTSQK